MLHRNETNLNYLQDVDFKLERDDIVKIVNGDLPVAQLANVLNPYTSDVWEQQPAPVSVSGAKVLYFGMNKKIYPTQPNFKEVLIVELSDKDTAKFSGKKLYIMLDKI